MHEVSRSLGIIVNNLFSENRFLFGLFIKLIFLVCIYPIIQENWFVPFVVSFLNDPSISPWNNFFDSGGDLLAFPYGPTMLLICLPATYLGAMLDTAFNSVYFSGFGFRFTLFVADLCLLLVLLGQFGKYWKQIITYYWLSPLVLYIVYWHGQIDLIPVVLLFYSIGCLKKGDYRIGGIILALSVTSKYSMLIGVPIIFIYLWLNQNVKGGFWETFSTFSGASSLIIVPFLISPGFLEMVVFNSEINRLYLLSINLGDNLKIYLLPTIYLLFLYYAWRMLRMNYELLLATLTVGFSIIIFLTPPPPGWLLWLVPLFALHQSKNSGGANYLIALFSIFFISYHVIYSLGANLVAFNHPISMNIMGWDYLYNSQVQSVLNTLMVSFGCLIGIQIYREGIQGNDYYHLGRKPLVIGITGDSGTGKSTFAKAVTKLFGSAATVNLEGDDYHNWDRESPMWKSVTHLNPRANRLFDLVRDLRTLLDGSSVNARSYDHLTGLFSSLKRKTSKNLILISGLHTLYLKSLVDEIDKSVYLMMDERLRISFKTERDLKRGRSTDYTLNEIKKRQQDSEKYIFPQSERADVVFNILPVNPDDIDNKSPSDIKLKLQVLIKSCPYYNELIRSLIGVCNLHVNLNDINEIGGVDIEIQGDVEKEDIRLATTVLAPHIDELIDMKDGFSDGILGIMELVTLVEINDDLTVKRRRNYA